MKKACPVVLRNQEGDPEILVFKHPLAGTQLVKGTIEPGEADLAAAERELREEAGIALRALYQLLEWQRHPDEPIWAICMMESGHNLPEQWQHLCEDDGGHLFEYFWHPFGTTAEFKLAPCFC
jgi:NTP pyrophosphohydrolases including oxidative damage repair enzymes